MKLLGLIMIQSKWCPLKKKKWTQEVMPAMNAHTQKQAHTQTQQQGAHLQALEDATEESKLPAHSWWTLSLQECAEIKLCSWSHKSL